MALYIHVSVNCKTCTNSIVTSFLASKVAASGVEAAADVDVLSSVCDSSTSALSMNLGSPFISSSQIREVVMSARKGAQDRSSEPQGLKDCEDSGSSLLPYPFLV